MQIAIIPQLHDNYSYVIHDNTTAIVIDPSTAQPILDFLKKNNLKLTWILNTHHHDDHIGGNAMLKAKTHASVAASVYDTQNIAIDLALKEGETRIEQHRVQIIHIPGHTLGHIAYYFPDLQAVFSGDTLFSLGCGRLFEGTPEQMLLSLRKLAALPSQTMVYCGHEYTEKNGRFALMLEGENEFLKFYYWTVEQLVTAKKPTMPSTIAIELNANPFLRLHSPQIRATLKMQNASDIELFSAIRKMKDAF